MNVPEIGQFHACTGQYLTSLSCAALSWAFILGPVGSLVSESCLRSLHNMICKQILDRGQRICSHQMTFCCHWLIGYPEIYSAEEPTFYNRPGPALKLPADLVASTINLFDSTNLCCQLLDTASSRLRLSHYRRATSLGLATLYHVARSRTPTL